MWCYVTRVLVPYQRADAAAHQRPRGNLSDLYPRWFGARELLLHHRNPYDPEVTRDLRWAGRQSYYTEHGDWFLVLCVVLAAGAYYAVLILRPPRANL